MLQTEATESSRSYRRPSTQSTPCELPPSRRLEEGCVRYVRISLDRFHASENPISCVTCIRRTVSGDDTPYNDTFGNANNAFYYLAISYAWGDPTPRRQILVNGRERMIAENLWQFLRQARAKPELLSGWLWIDALCINQTSPEEIMDQVGIISSIFRGADRVVVWLGQSYDDSDVAMQALAVNSWGNARAATKDCYSTKEVVLVDKARGSDPDRIPSSKSMFDGTILAGARWRTQGSKAQANYQQDLKTQQEDWVAHISKAFVRLCPWLYRKHSEDMEAQNDEWVIRMSNAMISLCQRPYWKRLWVFQELRCAQNIQLMCGETVIRWTALSNIWPLMAQLRVQDEAIDHILRQSLATRMIQLRARPIYFSLWNLLEETKDLDCSQGEDRVYALLSVAIEGHEDIKAAERHLDSSDLAHCVLRNKYAMKPPSNLDDVVRDCEFLEDVFRMFKGSMSGWWCHERYVCPSGERTVGRFNYFNARDNTSHPDASWSTWAQVHAQPVVTRLLRKHK
jgi:hypothetical protein